MNREPCAVMALIFASLTAALACLLFGPRRLAAPLLAASLALAGALFLFEIHDPADGFAMPWLQVRAGAPERAG